MGILENTRKLDPELSFGMCLRQHRIGYTWREPGPVNNSKRLIMMYHFNFINISTIISCVIVCSRPNSQAYSRTNAPAVPQE